MTRQVATCVAIVWAMFVQGNASAQTPSFNLVGTSVPFGGARATAISADGRVAAGFSIVGNGIVGFTWTREGGQNDFGLLPGMPQYTNANAINQDGSVVVGASNLGAYRYRGTGTLEQLGFLPGYPGANAYGVSGDGNVVVGRVNDGSIGQAFRWTPGGGMQGLGFAPGDFDSQATAVSRDGRTVVGLSRGGGGVEVAVVWRSDGQVQVLPSTQGRSAAATATNFDGSIVVGLAGSSRSAALWRNGLLTNLGVAPGYFFSTANGVSDNGNVVVGTMQGSDFAAGIWTAEHGMERLADYLDRIGVLVPAGYSLTDAYGVSADGMTIVGRANGPGTTEGFVVTIPTPNVILPLLCLAMPRQRRSRRFCASH